MDEKQKDDLIKRLEEELETTRRDRIRLLDELGSARRDLAACRRELEVARQALRQNDNPCESPRAARAASWPRVEADARALVRRHKMDPYEAFSLAEAFTRETESRKKLWIRPESA